jgi:hypothetical protein
LYRLDAEEYPSLTLALDEKGELFPKLLVSGGSSGYAVSLSPGDDKGRPAGEMLSYVNPDTHDLPYSYRGVGRTYPGLEIEERFFTTDADLVISLIQHFAVTNHWKPDVPFTVGREDGDGLIREYDQILGENDEYTEPY